MKLECVDKDYLLSVTEEQNYNYIVHEQFKLQRESPLSNGASGTPGALSNDFFSLKM